MIRSDTVVGAIGGLAVGYVLWLLAFSIADDNATVGQWAPPVLILSVGWRSARWCGLALLRRRRKLSVGGVRVRPAGTAGGAVAWPCWPTSTSDG